MTIRTQWKFPDINSLQHCMPVVEGAEEEGHAAVAVDGQVAGGDHKLAPDSLVKL